MSPAPRCVTNDTLYCVPRAHTTCTLFNFMQPQLMLLMYVRARRLTHGAPKWSPLSNSPRRATLASRKVAVEEERRHVRERVEAGHMRARPLGKLRVLREFGLCIMHTRERARERSERAGLCLREK